MYAAFTVNETKTMRSDRMKKLNVLHGELVFELDTSIADTTRASLGMIAASGVKVSLLDDDGRYSHTHSLEELLGAIVILDQLKIQTTDIAALKKRLVYMESCERVVSEINIASTLRPVEQSIDEVLEECLA